MRWSVKIGRFFGIDVFIHVTFLLLLAFVGLTQWLGGGNAVAAAGAVVFFLAVFLCVLLHEFGHALAARQYGIHTRDIMLLPIGGVARLEKMPENPVQELWVALAGPLVNVVIALGLFFGLNIRGVWDSFGAISTVNGSLPERLLAINIFLVVFNLLPAFPMDGGRVLRALLALRMSYPRATRLAATVGQGMAIVFGFAGLFLTPMLLLIALFVWVGASQEAAAVEFKASMGGARVRDAMLTRFRHLSPSQSLGDAARQLLEGSQQDFPVMHGDKFLGLLIRRDLIDALQNRGESVRIENVMRREIRPVQADEPLEDALGNASAEKQTTIPVFEGDELVGLLTAENVGEFYMIRAALGHMPSQPPRGSQVPPIIAPPPLGAMPRPAGG